MEIKTLNWDSDFFGIKIGKLEIINESEFSPIIFQRMAEEGGYELIYVFTYNLMLPGHLVLKSDLKLVDVMITMSKRITEIDIENIGYDFRTQLSEKELEECYLIADQTAKVSRFYREKAIGEEKTMALYRKWIDNALNNSYSDGLFVYKTNEIIKGIHLIKKDVANKLGYFTLTGTDAISKNMGVGTSLWRQSFAYFANKYDIFEIRSPFSMQNRESFNFHLKKGFNKVEELKYIYHYNTKQK